MPASPDKEAIAHNYHDHSDDNESPCTEGTRSSSSDHSFPTKLHYMLGELEKDGLSHIVSWQPHGRCFIVRNKKEFTRSVLACWFRQSKFSSFQRQLNLYGFKRITTGEDKGSYYHELFLRGRPMLCCQIQRFKVKGTGNRKPSSPQTEPNFYLMPFLPTSNTKAGKRTVDSIDSLNSSTREMNLQNTSPSPVLGFSLRSATNCKYESTNILMKLQKSCPAPTSVAKCSTVEGKIEKKTAYCAQNTCFSFLHNHCAREEAAMENMALNSYHYILSTLGHPILDGRQIFKA